MSVRPTLLAVKLQAASERAAAEAGRLSREGDTPASDAMMAEADALSAYAARIEELASLVFAQRFAGGRRELFKALTLDPAQTGRALRRSRLGVLG